MAQFDGVRSDGFPQVSTLFAEGGPPVRDPAGDVPLGEEIEAGKLGADTAPATSRQGHPEDGGAALPPFHRERGPVEVRHKDPVPRRT